MTGGTARTLFALTVVAATCGSVRVHAAYEPPDCPPGSSACRPEPEPREAPGYRQLVPPAPATQAPPGQATPYVEPPRASNAWRVIPRALLYVPRRVIEMVTTPFYYALVAYQKYRLKYRVLDAFFNDQRTFGLIPTAFVETGFGLNGGLRVIHRDLFGRGVRLYLRASWGGLYRHRYFAELELGDLLGPLLDLSLEAQYNVRPRMRFYGIGNADELEEEAPLSVALPIDPIHPRAAVDARYRVEEVRFAGTLGIRLTNELRATLHHRWTRALFKDATDLSGDFQIAKIYETDALVGWEEGLFNHYTELAFEFSRLRTRYPWISSATPSSGWEARIYGGVAAGVRGDPSRFATSGATVARYFDLYEGDRVLLFQLTADAVHGKRERIPFTSYPSLGGWDRLRGYLRYRFRDRFATLLTVEYRFPVNDSSSGFLFSDIGRVWPYAWLVDVHALDEFRVAFGGGLLFYIGGSLLTRLQIAGSMDGTFFFTFRL